MFNYLWFIADSLIQTYIRGYIYWVKLRIRVYIFFYESVFSVHIYNYQLKPSRHQNQQLSSLI